MVYEEIAPSIQLKHYINCFWMIHSPEQVDIMDRTFPDGCQEIIFNLETQVRRDDGQGFFDNPEVELVGQMTRPYNIVTRGRQTFFGVKFFPHSFSAFTHESINDLKDQSIDAHLLLGKEFRYVIERLHYEPSLQHFAHTMEAFFARRLSTERPRTYQLVERAVQHLFSDSDIGNIDALAHRLGVSDRYLQQTFKQHVGLTPKQLWKMIRFQRSFRYLSGGDESITDVAYRCGYYDHAHFAHDFKSLAGMTPSQYQSTTLPLNQFFLAPGSRTYLCNYADTYTSF